MNWYSGSISEAVALSKARNAIFVVYVEGNDELSQKLRGFINQEKIKTKLEGDEFVAIRVEGGSTSYMQFAQIYQLVPLPSLFFIGKNGTPLEIATGVISSADELEAKIENVLKLAGYSQDKKEQKEKEEKNDVKAVDSSTSQSSSVSLASAASVSVTPLSLSSNISITSTSPTTSVTENFISNEQKATVNEVKTGAPSNIICDGDVCYKKDENNKENKEFNEKSETEVAEKIHSDEVLKEEETKKEKEIEKETLAQPASVSSVQEQNNEDSKVEHAKKLLEEKRKEREAEDARHEREREIRRRKEGQEMQNFKKLQKDQELQQLKEKIQREKLEEQAARQRILEQIAADRAERAQRMNLSPPSSTQQTKTNEPSTSQKQSSKEGVGEFARIQFRRQTGEAETHNFLPTDQFKDVRDFVRNTLLNDTKIKEFSLATTFPRREFTLEDDTRTLQELDLYPSAVLLVLTPTITSVPAAVVARSGGFVNIFNSIFWGMLSPIFYIFNYVKGFITGRRPANNAGGSGQKRTNSDTTVANEVSKRRNIDRLQNNEIIDDGPSTGMSVRNSKSVPYKRVGSSNIHRLRDQKDSDDENNTWNGNSTQQQ